MTEYIIRTTNMPEHVREAISTWYDITNEVVRCRDCKYAIGTPEQLVCEVPCGDSTASSAWCHPDGFCAWGERR